MGSKLHFNVCFDVHKTIRQDCEWLCPYQKNIHANYSANQFLHKCTLQRMCLSDSRFSIASSPHGRPQHQVNTRDSIQRHHRSEIHKNSSLFAKRGGDLIRRGAQTIGLPNDVALYVDPRASPLPPCTSGPTPFAPASSSTATPTD